MKNVRSFAILVGWLMISLAIGIGFGLVVGLVAGGIGIIVWGDCKL